MPAIDAIANGWLVHCQSAMPTKSMSFALSTLTPRLISALWSSHPEIRGVLSGSSTLLSQAARVLACAILFLQFDLHRHTASSLYSSNLTTCQNHQAQEEILYHQAEAGSPAAQSLEVHPEESQRAVQSQEDHLFQEILPEVQNLHLGNRVHLHPQLVLVVQYLHLCPRVSQAQDLLARLLQRVLHLVRSVRVEQRDLLEEVRRRSRRRCLRRGQWRAREIAFLPFRPFGRLLLRLVRRLALPFSSLCGTLRNLLERGSCAVTNQLFLLVLVVLRMCIPCQRRAFVQLAVFHRLLLRAFGS